MSSPCSLPVSLASSDVPSGVILGNPIDIDIRLRSLSKAARNDPRSTPPPEYYLQLMSLTRFGDIPVDDTDGELSEDVEFAEFNWLEQMDGFAVDHKKNSQIAVGHCDGSLIRRDDIQATFRTSMEEPCEETRDLAFDLFDRYRCLKIDLIDHPVKKGTGVWGQELHRDDILLITDIRVDERYRRHGIGSELMRAMLQKCRHKSDEFFVITHPQSVRCESTVFIDRPHQHDGPNSQPLAIAQRFLRSLGFRRIGLSIWFGFAADHSHPSHELDPLGDYSPPEFRYTSHGAVKSLLYDIPTLDNANYVERLRHISNDAESTDSKWESADSDGNTVLHTPAINCKPSGVAWILEKSKNLRSQRNSRGEPPEDALKARLEDLRATLRHGCFTEDVSDQFAGFDPAALSCLIQLSG